MSTAPYESRHSQLTKIVKRLGVNKHVIKTIATRNQQVSALMLEKKTEPTLTHGKLRKPTSEFSRLFHLSLMQSLYELDWIDFIFKYEKGNFILLDGKLHEIVYIYSLNGNFYFMTNITTFTESDFHVAQLLDRKMPTLNKISFDKIRTLKPFEKVVSRYDTLSYVQIF